MQKKINNNEMNIIQAKFMKENNVNNEIKNSKMDNN